MEPTRQEEVVEDGRATTATAAPRPKRRKRNTEISFIHDKYDRKATLSTRRKGLFKKAVELSQLCGARVAVIVFSQRGTAFAVGSPSVDDVLRVYAPVLPADEGHHRLLQVDDDAPACRAAVEAALRRRTEETDALVKAEQARMDTSIGEKVTQAMARKRFWWEADVDQLGEAELPEFARALQRLRDDVQRHVDQRSSAAHLPPTPLLPQ